MDFVEQRYAPVQHGALPNVSLIYNDVFRWLNNAKLELPSSPAGALSDHLASEEYISDAPSLDTNINSDAIDRWQDNISQEDLDRLKEKLESGSLPEFLGVRLL